MLLGCALLLLNTSYVQNTIIREATGRLSEKLNTRVAIDSVSINVFTQDISLYGISIDDHQQRRLMDIGQIEVDLILSKLLQRDIIVEKVRITGLDAHLVSGKKSEDSVANYQFLVDAFKKEPRKAEDKGGSGKKGIQFDMRHLYLSDIHVTYDDAELTLGEARYTEDRLRVDRLRVTTDNHKPRRNAQRPHRGFFDTGHLDITTSMEWAIHCLKKDSLACTLTRCNAADSVTGINITDLRFRVETSPSGRAIVSDMVVQQTNTVIKVPKAVVCYAATPRSLTYYADSISGTTQLKDISRPFAPALSGFSIPLNLSLNLSGTDSTMAFHNVKVSTDDRRLTIAATGGIDHLKDSHKLAVRFNVSRMNAKNGIAEKIISQFHVKKYMMKQLHRLGDIGYAGRFNILWHREEFQGTIQTNGGPINFQFALDENTKFLHGSVDSHKFLLGEVMEIEHIGPVACHADFTFDYSKPRTAQMRREKGGKLPIGNVSASVGECSYKGIHLKNLTVDINSDGAEAKGNIKEKGKRIDLYCSFSFTDTEEMHKMKITNPGIKFHKRDDKDNPQ